MFFLCLSPSPPLQSDRDKKKRASLGSFQGKPYIRARMPAISVTGC